MTLARWEPAFAGLDEMRKQFDRFFTTPPWLLRPEGMEESLTVADWTPSVDITETDKEYLVKAEIPEVKKEDVKLTVEDGVLTLQGERKTEKEEKGKRFHRTERTYGSFLRSFSMPPDADETKVAAEFKDGMLYVHMPKSEKAKPKAIDVKIVQ